MTLPILITGGAGFIGSHLVDRLATQGRRALVLDDLSTGSLTNLEVDGALFEFVEGNAQDAELVLELARRCSGIVHLAASVGVRQVVEAPGRTLRNNLSTTLAVAAAAGALGLPLLVASTSEVYGKSDALPFVEDGDLVLGATIKGRWSYAAAKATGEWLVLSESRESGFEVSVARLFNTVGPRQQGRYGMVLPRFVAAAHAGRPIEVFGDGRQTRCFAHVEDVTEALLRLYDRTTLGQLNGQRVFNVGSNEEVSIFELAERVRSAAGSTSSIRRIPYTEAFGSKSGFEDMPRRVPNLAALDKLLEGLPRRPLEAIIAELVTASKV